MKYEVWQVTYRFETPGDRPSNTAAEIYVVIARDATEAKKKADDFFVDQSPFKQELLDEGAIRYHAKQYSKPLSLPKLSASDRNEFTLTPNIVEGRLEFIVKRTARGKE